MKNSEWAAWFGAISTFLAVIVALFKEEISRWWRRPELTISLKLGSPDCHRTTCVYSFIHKETMQPVQAKAHCYYFRIWVENTGNAPVRKIHVYASNLFEKQGKHYSEIDEFPPMNFKWSHTHEIYAEKISPKMGRHCDISHIADPKYKKINGEYIDDPESEDTIMAVDLEVLPNTKSHLLTKGQYQMYIKIAADNHKPITKMLEFDLKGEWFEKEAVMLYKGIQMQLEEPSNKAL